MQILLWIALGLFFIAIVAPRRVAYPIGAVGWIFFALHWAYQPLHYLAVDDYFNVIATIYVLNILRNAFVLTATGNQWFGLPENSFYISHNVIAKFGSIGALIVISYLVFKLLPELLDMVVGVYDLLKGGIVRAS